MPRIAKYENVVRELLVEDFRTREDDNYLYMRVCEKGNNDIRFLSYITVTNLIKDGLLPSPKTIERVRRKLQSKDAKLKPNVYVEEAREFAEEDYVNYARS